jgi:hypothetical protein
MVSVGNLVTRRNGRIVTMTLIKKDYDVWVVVGLGFKSVFLRTPECGSRISFETTPKWEVLLEIG